MWMIEKESILPQRFLSAGTLLLFSDDATTTLPTLACVACKEMDGTYHTVTATCSNIATCVDVEEGR